MHVQTLAAADFRNLGQIALLAHPRFNVLHGDNGQGKTNVLEAIYLLATLRSFRTSRIEEMIRFGSTTATVQARVHRQAVERQLTVQLALESGSAGGSGGGGGKRRKDAQVDGKPARAMEYFGGMNAVLFAPDDLQLPKGPPAGRRRFLDRAVWNTCPAFLREAQTYERVLRSRNAVLRPLAAPRTGPQRPDPTPAPAPAPAADAAPLPSPSTADLLDVYDEQLADAGAWLLYRRRDYLQQVSPLFAESFERVGRTGLPVLLQYQTCAAVQAAAQEVPALRQALLFQLRRDRKRDLLRGYTHSGPHADDWEVLLAGRPAAVHASQGQLRALVLALKIAEIRHLAAVLHDPPVLLLDDVSSELDPTRSGHLFEFLREVPCQAFITTTSPRHIPLGSDRRDFRVNGGSLDASNGDVVY